MKTWHNVVGFGGFDLIQEEQNLVFVPSGRPDWKFALQKRKMKHDKYCISMFQFVSHTYVLIEECLSSTSRVVLE